MALVFGQNTTPGIAVEAALSSQHIFTHIRPVPVSSHIFNSCEAVWGDRTEGDSVKS